MYSAHRNKMNRDIEMIKKLRNQHRDEPSGLQMASKPESDLADMMPAMGM